MGSSGFMANIPDKTQSNSWLISVSNHLAL